MQAAPDTAEGRRAKKRKAAMMLAVTGCVGTWLVGFGIFTHQLINGRATPLELSVETTILTMLALGVAGLMIYSALAGPFWTRARDAAFMCVWTVPLFKIVLGLPFPPSYARDLAPVAVLGVCLIILLAKGGHGRGGAAAAQGGQSK